ncbi:hypothetical protein GH714_024438 [Hevea brasiliensis]|uniref:Formin-like protein n=1 Tax=Hevea brasiliensis TaxID=3981 RepID=A0A6A6MLV3_HEVBR|nr:hypothetical protein GH714_024438 [Hevea brasiliensis]
MRRIEYADNGDSTTNDSHTVKLCHVLGDFALCIFGGEPGIQKEDRGSAYEPISRSIDWGLMTAWQDFVHLKEANEDLNFCFPEETSDMASEVIPRVDCMRKNNNLFHVSGESGSNIQHTRYLDSVFPIRIVPKRNLLQSIAEVPASAPVPVAGSPFFSPVPSADLAPSPVSTPSPVSMPSPVFSTPSPQKPFFLKVVIHHLQLQKMLLQVQLLIQMLSQISQSSPHNSFGLVNSIKEEKVDHQSLNKNSSHHGKDSSLDSIKSTALHASPDEIALSAESIGKFSDTIAWVPPPPGRVDTPSQPPPPLPMGSKVPRPPTGLKHPPNAAPGERDGAEGDANNPKAKLKPFFWDKVLANPDHSMVWHQIKSGSFQFNEEMIETLFGYAPADRNKTDRKKESSSQDSTFHYIQILDTKKAQNLSILLRALNVTIEEVCDALHEGNELPIELLQTLLKMAPTADEELKLRLYSGELSQLGNAERSLKMLVDIPFAYKRLEALLFMCTLQEEVAMTKESFDTLEVACKELRNSRLFLKLLEAVLKTGNRMNDGTFRGGAQAFKLDTLLKLSDVKGTDGKTTLLHFVVQEIIRSEGVRAARVARESHTFSNVSVKSNDLLEDITADTEYDYSKLGLQVVSCLSSELGNVKKAAIVDPDSLTGTVAKLGNSLLKTQDFLNKDMKSLGEDSKFHETLKSVVQNAEVDIMWLLEEEKRIMALVKSTGDYFHGNAGKDEGLRLFVIVRDFLIILDKVCKQVGEAQKRSEKLLKKESSTASSNSSTSQQPSPDFRTRLFPAIQERKIENSSSDDENE